MGFAARTGLLFALVLSTLGAARNENGVVRLLEQMRGASGPVWQTHIVSVARLTFNGEPTVVSSESEGLRVSVRHCIGEVCDGTYYDGSRVYSFNMNGTMVASSQEGVPFLRALRIVASLDFLTPSFLERGGRVGGAGTATLDGRSYRTIVVGESDAVPLRLFVDPQSGLIRYARTLDGRDTFEYRNYRRVGAFELPFEVLHDGRIFERYDDRAAVSSAFHPPHGLVPAFSGTPGAIATDPKAVTPIVDCSIGGIAVRCLIDTGNSGLSMSAELASRLGAPVVGTYQVRGLGGYSTQVVRAGPLRIGNAAYPDAYYIVLSDLRRYGYDAVLGADLLGASGIEIDSAAHTVRLQPPPLRNAITVPLTFEHFVPVVTVGLGEIQTQLAVDTGDESNVNLSYEFYAKHPGLFSVTQRRSVGGIGGTSVEMIGEIPEVQIGAYRTGPQRIGTTQTLQGTAFGHLGAAFLDQFVVQLDYAASELRLVPRRG
jgi:Aspartyl protease